MRKGAGCLLLGLTALHGQSFSRWYEAWQQGEALRAQGAWAQALNAYQQAAKAHPRPEKRTITYGTNTLNDYYPYQRMAECHLRLRQTAQAEAALAMSQQMGEPEALRAGLRPLLEELKRPAPSSDSVLPPPSAPVTKQTPPSSNQAPASSGAQVLPPPPSAAQPSLAKTQEPLPRPGSKPTETVAVQAPPTPEVVASTPVTAPSPSTAVPSSAAPSADSPAQSPPQGRRVLWFGGMSLLALAGGGLALALRRRARHAPQEPTGAGPTLGPYQALSILGKGGCGITYLGVHTRTKERVALKVPHAHLLDDGDFLARFRQEAEMGAHLDHPNIVRILDPGPPTGPPWIAMELVTGRGLDAYLAERGPLELPEALAIAIDIAEAMAFAHAKAIVHRDLKPANVMIQNGRAKVLDFGIARMLDSDGLTKTHVFLGTPQYAAPESIVDSKVGPAADRYAFGIMLFEFLTGRPPFSSPNIFNTLEMHRSAPVPNISAVRQNLPPRLIRLIERLLDKRPEKRPEDGELLMALRNVAAQIPPDHPSARISLARPMPQSAPPWDADVEPTQHLDSTRDDELDLS